MKNRVFYHISVLIILALAVSSCKTNAVSKTEDKAKAISLLENLKSQNNYRIDVDAVYPLNSVASAKVTNALLANTGNNASRINVSGDGNFIEIKDDHVQAYLPFFGEMRMSGGSYGGRNVAIELDEPLEKIDKNLDYTKRKLVLKFKAKQKEGDNDSYDIKIEIFGNRSASIDVTPVFRTYIRYDGRIAEQTSNE